ncbi:MAG: pentapeptide repeat-containing protein [Candidatus Krumholzibacteriota bacterium]|nr:pentapeptide repeat-containing protein [Candidatus Krumholzibacteriota bacterium]
MAEQAHAELIEKSVRVWNEWRQSDPRAVPDLSGRRISNRRLRGANLRGARLAGALLPGVDLRGANLEGADLRGADLMEADLRGAWLAGADLRRTNLMGANLKRADLSGARLEDTILFRADLGETGCVCKCLWFELLMDLADGLRNAEEEGFCFEEMADSRIESQFIATRNSRLEIVLADPVSTRVGYEILGALNRLYREVSHEELLGPMIKVGLPGAKEAGDR